MLQGIFRIISRAQSGASFWFRKPRTWCGSTHGCTSHQPCRHCKFLTPQCDAIHSPGPLMSGHEGVHQRIRGLLSQLQPLAARQEAVRYVWAARCQVPAGMKTKGHAQNLREAAVRTTDSQYTVADFFHTLCAGRPPSSLHPDLGYVAKSIPMSAECGKRTGQN